MTAAPWNGRVNAMLATPAAERCNCTPGVCGEMDELKPGEPVRCDECGLVMVAASAAEIIREARNTGAGTLRTIPVIDFGQWMPEVRRS